jgi:hypothetical protein
MEPQAFNQTNDDSICGSIAQINPYSSVRNILPASSCLSIFYPDHDRPSRSQLIQNKHLKENDLKKNLIQINQSGEAKFGPGSLRGKLRTTGYRGRASTSVMSSGCSLSPIQSSTADVTAWLICTSGRCRFALTRSINRSSPNSPNSFSGSVTPSL